MSILTQTIQEDLEFLVSLDLPWEKLSGSRFAITGAGGFIGNYLVRVLVTLNKLSRISKPITIVALARNISAAEKNYFDLLDDQYFELVECDLSTLNLLDLEPTNYIIHAASQASPRYYAIDPIGTFLPNVIGTTKLLQWLEKSNHPQGFLFLSSSEIYGANITSQDLSEKDLGYLDPTAIRACYAESKRAGETLCVAWHMQQHLPTYIVRLFHTYGPGLKSNDGRVFADFAFDIIRGNNIQMKSNGSARRAFCYVVDAIEAIFTVLLKGQPGTPYNIGNPDAVLSVVELANLLANLFPERKISIETPKFSSNALLGTVDQQIPDISQLKNLGWQPRTSPSIGFRRMIEAYL